MEFAASPSLPVMLTVKSEKRTCPLSLMRLGVPELGLYLWAPTSSPAILRSAGVRSPCSSHFRSAPRVSKAKSKNGEVGRFPGCSCMTLPNGLTVVTSM